MSPAEKITCRIRLLAGVLVFSLFQAPPNLLSAAGKGGSSSLRDVTAAGTIVYVQGTTQKVCQLTGETDKEFNIPSVNQTEKRFGLVGTDRGYSFEHKGILFFLFGDTSPTALFDGKPNKQTDLPRAADDNDAIAFSQDTAAGTGPLLTFVTDSIGAYRNPVVLDARGKPAITLRTNETPIAGVSDGGRMYVIFGTDNFLSNPPAGSSSPNGGATRSVVAVSDDSGKTFHFLYNFSTAPAKFIMTTIASAQDGHLYFWGTQGDSLFRKSPPFLARKPVGRMEDSTAIEYYHGLKPDGTPIFMAGETNAVPLFHDSLPGAGGKMEVADCMGEVSVEWNRFVHRWVMLYNSSNNTTTNPRGIVMRVAEKPWGEWSPPQTVFNPTRDQGLCYFIHRAVTPTQEACDSLSGPGRLADGGGDYGPYIIARFTRGDSVQGSSTFYYVMSTWNPYNTVIMKSTIQTVPATGVSQVGETIPYTMSLEQNYPNPFNPSTTISFSVARKSPVRLQVFDIDGQLVKTLVDQEMDPGRYKVTWRGDTRAGNAVATGVYFVKLQAQEFESVKKMLMLR